MPEREVKKMRFEVRAEENLVNHKASLVGLPIVYGQVIQYGWRREVIDPGAVDENTDLTDVPFLIGHNTGMVPLARSRNNNENSTMQLTVNDGGMDIRVDLDTENNAEARALYSAVKRGDMSGMSFMFIVESDSWDDIESDYPKRTILSIRKVLEVSAVAFPAYPQTTIEAAAEDAAPDGARASLESARKQLEEDRAAQSEAERRTAALERLNNLIKEGTQNV